MGTWVSNGWTVSGPDSTSRHGRSKAAAKGPYMSLPVPSLRRISMTGVALVLYHV